MRSQYAVLASIGITLAGFITVGILILVLVKRKQLETSKGIQDIHSLDQYTAFQGHMNCAEPGGACSSTDDCCTALCLPTSCIQGQCITSFCKNQGSRCKSDCECCSGHCVLDQKSPSKCE
jgi:hypothetical protein